MLNHPVILAPILPTIRKHDHPKCQQQGDASNPSNHHAVCLKARYPAVFNDGGVPQDCTVVGVPFTSQSSSTLSTTSKNQPLSQPSWQLPSWTPLYTPPVYFEDDYDRETGQLDDHAMQLPVTRKITALTVRKPHHDYLALGDSAGFVLIFPLQPSPPQQIHRPVARLESIACQQRARPEQERLRADLHCWSSTC